MMHVHTCGHSCMCAPTHGCTCPRTDDPRAWTLIVRADEIEENYIKTQIENTNYAISGTKSQVDFKIVIQKLPAPEIGERAQAITEIATAIRKSQVLKNKTWELQGQNEKETMIYKIKNPTPARQETLFDELKTHDRWTNINKQPCLVIPWPVTKNHHISTEDITSIKITVLSIRLVQENKTIAAYKEMPAKEEHYTPATFFKSNLPDQKNWKIAPIPPPPPPPT